MEERRLRENVHDWNNQRMIIVSAFSETKLHKHKDLLYLPRGTFVKPHEGNESECRGSMGEI